MRKCIKAENLEMLLVLILILVLIFRLVNRFDLVRNACYEVFYYVKLIIFDETHITISTIMLTTNLCCHQKI